MAKLAEYLAKVFADSNIEIPESSTIEQNQDNENVEIHNKNETNNTQTTVAESTTNVDYAEEYTKLQNRIKELEDANFKLIKNLPVQEDIKSVEQMIYETVHGMRGDLKNGNGNTRSRS